MHLHPDTLLQGGKYRIIRTLGQGGFGITYEAEQVALKRVVAIKEFFMRDCCERSGDARVTVGTGNQRELVEKFRKKFIKEAETIASFDHDNIVRILDIFEENETAYYVMERLPGDSLAVQLSNSGPLPETLAIQYIRQVASALNYIHSRNTVHLDVKPSNILLNSKGEAVLVDFGTSKHYDRGEQTSTTPVGFSRGYAPLEQCQDDDVNKLKPATDIYALGATLYTLVTGIVPPEASSVNEDGLKRVQGVSELLWQAIEKAMMPKRKDRPQSIGEFLSLLGNNSTEQDLDEEPESTIIKNWHDPPSMPPKPLNKWGILLLLLGVFALIALYGGWLTGGKKIDEEIYSDGHEKEQNEIEFLIQAPKRAEVSQYFDVVFEIKGGSPSEFRWDVGTGFTLVYGPKKEVDGAFVSYSYVVQANQVGVYTLNEAYAIVNSQELHTDSVPITIIGKQGNSESSPAGSLVVSSQPLGATIWIDGKDTKKKTLAVLTGISPGEHTVKLVLEGYTDYIGKTTVVSGQQVALKPSLSAMGRETPSYVQNSSTVSSGVINGHEWVDLGLSVKWATQNIGATSPSDYGDFYSWAETSPKDDSQYTFVGYKYRIKGDSMYDEDLEFSKYNPYNPNYYTGVVDNKSFIERQDDAAFMNWGAGWRMPTKNELDELLNNCTWTWTSLNGVNGYKVTSTKNGASIFMPAGGTQDGQGQVNDGARGFYWSSTLDCTYDLPSIFGYTLHIDSSKPSIKLFARPAGHSVRPVTD